MEKLLAIQRDKGKIQQKRFQEESAEWKAIKESQKRQMDNLLNNQEWLEGLQEIRKINAENQGCDLEGHVVDEALEDSQDLQELEPPSSGKINKQKAKQIVELPPIKRPNSVKRRPRKAPVVIQQLKLAEEELLLQYKKEEEQKLKKEKEEREHSKQIGSRQGAERQQSSKRSARKLKENR